MTKFENRIYKYDLHHQPNKELILQMRKATRYPNNSNYKIRRKESLGTKCKLSRRTGSVLGNPDCLAQKPQEQTSFELKHGVKPCPVHCEPKYCNPCSVILQACHCDWKKIFVKHQWSVLILISEKNKKNGSVPRACLFRKEPVWANVRRHYLCAFEFILLAASVVVVVRVVVDFGCWQSGSGDGNGFTGCLGIDVVGLDGSADVPFCSMACERLSFVGDLGRAAQACK